MSFITSIRSLNNAVPGPFQPNVATIVGMQAMYEVRSLWKVASAWSGAITCSDSELALNNSFLKQKAAGWAAFALIDNTAMRGIARVCLITSRLIYCSEKKQALVSACGDWMKYAYNGDFHHSVKVVDPSTVSPIWQTVFTAATICWIQVQFQTVMQRIEKIAYLSFQVIKEAFLVCMAHMDAYDAFSLSREVGDEALKDLFVNLFYVKNKVIENESHIIEYIKEHEKEIEGVADLCGFPYSKMAQTLAGYSISAIKTVDAIGASIDARVSKKTISFAYKMLDRFTLGRFNSLTPLERSAVAANKYHHWRIQAIA